MPSNRRLPAFAALAAASALALTGIHATPASAAVDGPLIACDRAVTFDSSNEEWRQRSTSTGFNVFADHGLATFVDSDGQPPGAVQVNDEDSQWMELVSPELSSGTDHSFLNHNTVTFDYKNNTGVDYDLYVAVEGNNGERYFYVFADQVTTPDTWESISVPFEAAQWHTGFNVASGPEGAAPTAEEFAAALADLSHLAFSMEGQEGPDTTFFDNLAVDCTPADLALKKTSKGFKPGKTVTYNLTVTNKGEGWSSGWTLTDEVPSDLRNVEATSTDATCTVDGNAVECEGGELQPGASHAVTVTAKVPANFSGKAENNATVTGNEPDPNPDNNSGKAVDRVDPPQTSPEPEPESGNGTGAVPQNPTVPAGGEGVVATGTLPLLPAGLAALAIAVFGIGYRLRSAD